MQFNSGDNRLPTLADEARLAHSESLHHMEKATERAFAAGAALVEAKALCAHGEWGTWLAETGIPERTAQRYMLLFNSGLKNDIVSYLGLPLAMRAAGILKKAWPKAGRGRVFSGARGDETFWAVTFRPDDAEFSFYASLRCYGNLADGGDASVLSKPVAPLGLAIGLLSDIGSTQIEVSYDISTVEDATDWFGAVGARLVRHGAGLRLETA